ncbi:MAG: hypothetical protein HQ536_00580 [Parcubacteria group bacterium]|nr:hypothetical protein [Parcubacteria group bacterium]
MNYKKPIIIAAIPIVLLAIITGILVLRGGENTWICENEQWTKHGNPSQPIPSEQCGEPVVVCETDTKLCSDGSSIARILPECNFPLCPKEDLIQVENLQANNTITSPFIIEGSARGFWFFEASFPIKLYDDNGKLLTTTIAQAQGDWMTEDFVPFSAELIFDLPETDGGILVLEKDNPSDLPENADELRIPVVFTEETMEITLYYYNSELDKDESENIKCSRSGLVSLKREMPITQTPIQDSINLLLLGELTDEERAQGVSTEYPLEEFSLKGASLKDGVLTLEFTDPQNETIGGSCRVGILWFQIEATAKQFPEVQEVNFIPEEIFQP